MVDGTQPKASGRDPPADGPEVPALSMISVAASRCRNRGWALQGFIITHPLHKMAVLLELTGLIQMVEVSREQPITPFQVGQFGIQAMDVLDDLVPCHTLFTPNR
jgi:hypothetical protein